jgi:hypothetical protein
MVGGTHRQEGRRGGRDGGGLGSCPHVSHARAVRTESEVLAEVVVEQRASRGRLIGRRSGRRARAGQWMATHRL